MAYDKVIDDIDVHPDENEDGTLKGLRLQLTRRVVRKAEDGRTMDRGYPADIGEPLFVPVDDIGALISEMVSWPTYYATGESARDRREPVSWPNSKGTVAL